MSKKEFLKTDRADRLQAQVIGLQALDALKIIPVSSILRLEKQNLLLEYIEHDPSKLSDASFWIRFGTLFAHLHRAGKSEYFGFNSDNFIGATPQRNSPPQQWRGKAGEWSTFYWHYRIHPQLDLLKKSHPKIYGGKDKIEQIVADILFDVTEPPCLLHGDLWHGNFLARKDGEPVLIDPAVYYGHRETDLAMAKLFGGFDEQFFSAYGKAFPLQAGFEKREPLYQLYHLLNHVNLFGDEYVQETTHCIRRLLAD